MNAPPPRGRNTALLILGVLLAVSCSRSTAKPQRRTQPVSPAQDAAPGGMEALLEWRDFENLSVHDYGESVVWVPVGATSKRPVVIGVHGNADPPESLCSVLHDIVGTRAFVLCPRGIRLDKEAPYTFMSPQTLALEVEAGLLALERRFSGYVDASALVYVGFSRGAYLSVPVISTEPERYSRAILIEGGQDAWTQDRIRFFGAEGGKRVLFACGQEDCLAEGTRIAAQLKEVGVEARVAYKEGAGHVYTGPMTADLRAGFEWLIEGDPRWRP